MKILAFLCCGNSVTSMSLLNKSARRYSRNICSANNRKDYTELKYVRTALGKEVEKVERDRGRFTSLRESASQRISILACNFFPHSEIQDDSTKTGAGVEFS
jgi:hypothetical protein